MKLRIGYVLILSCCMIFESCSTWRKLDDKERGAVIGGGSGAIIGNAVSPGVGGTVIGGGLGAVTGGVIGNEIKKDKKRDRDRRY